MRVERDLGLMIFRMEILDIGKRTQNWALPAFAGLYPTEPFMLLASCLLIAKPRPVPLWIRRHLSTAILPRHREVSGRPLVGICRR